MDTPSTLSPTSPEAPIKFTEQSRYCTICPSLGKTYPKEFTVSLDKDDDEEEEDQVKDENKDKGSEQRTSQTNPRFFAMITLTL